MHGSGSDEDIIRWFLRLVFQGGPERAKDCGPQHVSFHRLSAIKTGETVIALCQAQPGAGIVGVV